jgi:predicted phosphohydrolase
LVSEDSHRSILQDDSFYIEKFSRILQTESSIDLDYHWFRDENLNFASDWNWIMEVVEKIEDIYRIQPIQIAGTRCLIHTNHTFNVYRSSKKEAVVQAIWEFLNWYNKNKQ